MEKGRSMQRYNEICDFLKENIESIEISGSGGSSPEFPLYDLYPVDYLKFSEIEINLFKENNEARNLINSILHLRRALDCQIDVFLEVFGLYKIFKRKNLGINKKLNFFKDIGIFDARTLERFNLLRNKIEHHYHLPEVYDIEVYYDLISSIISNMELAILTLSLQNELEFIVNSDEENDGKSGYKILDIKYKKFEIPVIEINLRKNREEIFSFKVDANEIEVFPLFYKVMYLLIKKESLIRNELILERL